MSAFSPPSVAERVLLHLSRPRFDQHSEHLPAALSQEGIASGVSISRSHVPRAVRELLREGLLVEDKRRVEGGEKRVKVYLITNRGLERARQVEERIRHQIVPAKIGGSIVTGMTIAQLEKAFHRRIDIMRLTGCEEYVDLDQMNISGATDLSDSPRCELFLDREDAIEQMKRFLKSRCLLLTVYGARGMGTSALVRHFVELLDEWNILWVSLSRYPGIDAIRARIDSFAHQLGTDSQRLLESSSGSNSLLIFDGYFDVDEGVVEMFSGLVDRREGGKIIVTCRDSTPSYNRFYRKEHLSSELVSEIFLKGLPEDAARRLLGNDDIPEEAFRRVYALSRGSPKILTMLRDRDEEGLRRNTTYTNEEIRFLLTEAAARDEG